MSRGKMLLGIKLFDGHCDKLYADIYLESYTINSISTISK